MKWILTLDACALMLIGIVTTGLYAANIAVTKTTVQQGFGVLTNIYYETAKGASGSTPTVNTALAPPMVTGSWFLTRKSSANLWSPQFANSIIIPAQTWVLDMWATITVSGTASVTINITNSAGIITATLVNSLSTSPISTSESQVVTAFACKQVTIPTNGYIKITLTASTSAFMVYWGEGQLTDFQIMTSVLST